MKTPDTSFGGYPAELQIDLGAIGHNLDLLRTHVPTAHTMAIVKANAYGHGAEVVSKAAIQAGVDWLGQAQLSEALDLHEFLTQAGLRDQVNIFSWIVSPAEVGFKQLCAGIKAGIELSASNLAELQNLVRAGHEVGQIPRVHLKIDVGHSRAGFTVEQWTEGVSRASEMVQAGEIVVSGIWSHLSCADEDSDSGQQITRTQISRFERACEQAYEAGLQGFIRHLSATSGGLWYPSAHFDMIRWGIGMYGYSPNPQRVNPTGGLELHPVMTLRAPLMSVKRISQGEAVSYNATWRAPSDTWIGLVPLGYADGILRAASNRGEVLVHTGEGDLRAPLVGRVCMDQFMINLGPETNAKRGDVVVLLGTEATSPSINDWAAWCDTINYEVMTRLGQRIPRVGVVRGVE